MIEILTGVLVVITAFYAWATYKILRANEKVVEVMGEQAEAMTRPYITISPILEADNPIFYLRIKNAGKTPANDLKLSIDKSFYKFGEKADGNDLSKYPVFNDTISSFHPGSEMDFSLAQGFKIFGEGSKEEVMPTEFTIIAEYSFDGKTVKENSIIDLRPYLGANIPQDAYIRKLKDIVDAIKHVSDSVKKP